MTTDVDTVDPVERYRWLERTVSVPDRVRRTGIPVRYRNQGLSDYHPRPETTRALAECQRYVPWFKHNWRSGAGLALIGPPGTHKTTLACLTGLDISRLGFAVRFGTVDGHVRDVKRRMDFDRLAKVESTRMEAEQHLEASMYREWELREAAYLYIWDDVGREFRGASGFAGAEVESVLRERYDRGLPFIVTSNLELDQWASEYSPALRSFIHEACEVIAFRGFDARARRVIHAGG